MTVDVLFVDSRETAVPAALERRGVRFDVHRLRIGDYVFAQQWAIERKTVRDLHLSASDGRLWRQLVPLRRAARPYLLVEGRSLGAGPLPLDAVRSALLAIADLGVVVIRSDDAADSAAWIEGLMRRSAGARRAGFVLRRSAVPAEDPAEAALAAAPGISTVTARAVLAHFGSLGAIASASVRDLEDVPGVGSARATAIVNLLQQTRR